MQGGLGREPRASRPNGDRLAICHETEGRFVLDDRLVNVPDEELPYPWEDVGASRRNRLLQKKHPIKEGKKAYLKTASRCPGCKTAPDTLSWFYFQSPTWTWGEDLCGRAGWIVVCDKCHRQTDFFLEVMS